MSTLSTREWFKLIGAVVSTEDYSLGLIFPKNSFSKCDIMTWDLRYGEQLYIKEIYEIGDRQILDCQVLTNNKEDNGLLYIQLENYLPGAEFTVVSQIIGEYDSI